MLAPGSHIGRYEIQAEVGRGGMATVYKGFHEGLQRQVAIKVLPDFFASDPVARERFQTEARAVARLRHPNIVAVFDYGEEEGVTYLVSEFLEGGSLARLMHRPHGLEEVTKLLSPIANALDHAHSQGILHRDIKPGNILLGPDGAPVLADFGLALMLESGRRLTLAGSSLGTPEYMAPEQGLGEDVTAAADIYSLGVVAYELLTGTPPFEGPTPIAVVLAHVQKPVPTLRERQCEVPEAVEQAIRRVLAKDPAERFQSAVEFVEAVCDSNGGETTQAAVVVVVLRPGPELSASSSDWRAEIRRLKEVRQRYLTVYGGKDYQALGDGMVACFEGVLPAVRCVADVRALGLELGLEFSAGVAFGEVMRSGASARGSAVELAREFSRLAGAGEILVTPEVEEIIRGFGPRFEPLGEGKIFRLAQSG